MGRRKVVVRKAGTKVRAKPVVKATQGARPERVDGRTTGLPGVSSPAEATRKAIQRHMTRVSVHSFNLARVRAQMHEEDMVDVLYSMAMDLNLAPEIRRLCAINVLEQARGKITTQLHDGNTVNPSDPALDGTNRTVGDQIDAARVAAAEMSVIQEWASVPYEQWPEHVRTLIGPDMMAAFTETVESAAP
jgi:hypothetical protein